MAYTPPRSSSQRETFSCREEGREKKKEKQGGSARGEGRAGDIFC